MKRCTGILFLLAIVLFLGGASVQAQEAKVIKVTGVLKNKLAEIDNIGACTFMSRPDAASSDINIKGGRESSRISGYNHDLNGNVVSDNNAYGFSTDLSFGVVSVDSDVVLEGIAGEQYGIDRVDVQDFAQKFKDRADTTISSSGMTTWDEDNNFGSAEDFQVLCVHNGKLKFTGDFEGYGVLVVYDDTSGQGKSDIRFEDNAVWHGAVIVYSADTQGNSDKIVIRLGNEGNGAILRGEDSLFDRALVFTGLRPGCAYAAKGGNKGGKKGSGTGDDTDSADKVRIIGALLIEGRQVEVRMNNAEILYSKDALVKVDEDSEASTSRQWEQWHESE